MAATPRPAPASRSAQGLRYTSRPAHRRGHRCARSSRTRTAITRSGECPERSAITPSAIRPGSHALSIAPTWGQTGSAAERLWSAHDASALGADSEFEADSRIAIDAGYGLGLRHGRGVLTPYAGLTLGDAGNRTVRTGTRWQFNPDTVVSVEATRQASDGSEPDNQVKLRAALRF